MEPYGFQIVLYLFLAGIAGGAAFFGSMGLVSGEKAPFEGGRRGVRVATVCALVGAVFLILDLARPGDFFLILGAANGASAISWGARILVLFILSGLLVWATVRNWGEEEIRDGFVGANQIGLWVLRLAALGLAIYPAFVLRQGDAFPLWQNSLIVPLIAVSAFHAGGAVLMFVGKCEDCRRKARPVEIGLGIVQLGLLVALFLAEGASVAAWGLALVAGTLVPLYLVFTKPNSLIAPRLALILLGTFVLRYWVVAEGQAI